MVEIQKNFLIYDSFCLSSKRVIKWVICVFPFRCNAFQPAAGSDRTIFPLNSSIGIFGDLRGNNVRLLVNSKTNRFFSKSVGWRRKTDPHLKTCTLKPRGLNILEGDGRNCSQFISSIFFETSCLRFFTRFVLLTLK